MLDICQKFCHNSVDKFFSFEQSNKTKTGDKNESISC